MILLRSLSSTAAKTIGLFQMESGGITGLSKQFDVKKLDDIIV